MRFHHSFVHYTIPFFSTSCSVAAQSSKLMPPSTSAASRKRPRLLAGCVEKLARDVLGPETAISKEAINALVSCHQAFLSEVSKGLVDIRPDNEEGCESSGPAIKTLVERVCVDHLNCRDLWEEAETINRERKKLDRSQNKSKKKVVLTEEMIAEQERLLAASKKKALDEKVT